MQGADYMQPAADHTSVLKMLTTQKTVASTVDPSNGDVNPYGLVYVESKPFGKSILQKGDLVVCNFNDKANVQGTGTTVEYMSSIPGSKPTQLTQSSSLLGCASLVINSFDEVFSADSGAKDAVGDNSNGKIVQTLKSSLLVEPWGSAYVPGQTGYPPGDGLWVADASTGKIVRINLGTGGKPTYTAVISGFAVNHGKPGSILGPSGMQYNYQQRYALRRRRRKEHGRCVPARLPRLQHRQRSRRRSERHDVHRTEGQRLRSSSTTVPRSAPRSVRRCFPTATS